MMQERHDVFVGNLTFNVTEDQLREVFRFVGLVKNVRVVTEKDSGKSKGFAFVEFHDANTALAAIKHLNGFELNSRKIVVGFPSHSNLREVAKQMGETFQGMGVMNNVDEELMVSRHNAEQSVIQTVELHEAWDILDALKKILAEDRRGNKLRTFVEENPQVVNAVYELEKRLGIVLPTHILMAQPKLPTGNPPLPANSQLGNAMGGSMGFMPQSNNNNMMNNNHNMNMNMNNMNMNMGGYDNNAAMWGAPQQPMYQDMGMPMDYNNNNNDYYGPGNGGFANTQNSSAGGVDNSGQQPPARRSRFK